MRSNGDARPTRCRNGHEYGYGRVLCGWRFCSCGRETGGHHTYYCRICGDETADPPFTANCDTTMAGRRYSLAPDENGVSRPRLIPPPPKPPHNDH